MRHALICFGNPGIDELLSPSVLGWTLGGVFVSRWIQNPKSIKESMYFLLLDLSSGREVGLECWFALARLLVRLVS